MPPTTIKLVYFEGRGRAEISRWVLEHAGVAYEDERIEWKQWKDFQPKTPTGVLPYVDIDGKQLGCSWAIACYLAKQYGLLGTDDWEEACIKMVCDMVEDTFNAQRKAKTSPEDKKEEAWKEYQDKALNGLMRFLTKQLDGGKQWLVGDKVSLADFAVAFVLGEYKERNSEQMMAYPDVAALTSRVTELPKIKKWIATRPDSTF